MLNFKRRQSSSCADKEYRLYFNNSLERRLYAKEQDGVLMRYPHKNKPKYTVKNNTIWETMEPRTDMTKIVFRAEEWKVTKWPLTGAKVKVFDEDKVFEGQVSYKTRNKGPGQKIEFTYRVKESNDYRKFKLDPFKKNWEYIKEDSDQDTTFLNTTNENDNKNISLYSSNACADANDSIYTNILSPKAQDKEDTNIGGNCVSKKKIGRDANKNNNSLTLKRLAKRARSVEKN